jgi:hypothetical protein
MARIAPRITGLRDGSQLRSPVLADPRRCKAILRPRVDQGVVFRGIDAQGNDRAIRWAGPLNLTLESEVGKKRRECYSSKLKDEDANDRAHRTVSFLFLLV